MGKESVKRFEKTRYDVMKATVEQFSLADRLVDKKTLLSETNQQGWRVCAIERITGT